ncbi:hypothetical protein L6172_01985 [Thalassospiraceae bacterium SW-3-3]|nr:hypothetical protein L6172_01985 [Thalassospiraceae bacterium SW-3-3]
MSGIPGIVLVVFWQKPVAFNAPVQPDQLMVGLVDTIRSLACKQEQFALSIWKKAQMEQF